MSDLEVALLRPTGAVAPRIEWALPVIELFDGCRLWERWSEHVGVDGAVGYGMVDQTGRVLSFKSGEVDRVRELIETSEADLMSVHRHARSGLDAGRAGLARMTFLFPYEPEDHAWLDAWGSLRFYGSDPELNRAGSMPGDWWAAAAELMVRAAVAFDAWYGSGIFHLQKDWMPHGRVYWQASFPRWGEGEVDWLPGLAPVFLISPRMLDPMGGLGGLAAAPVHEVLPVEYRDGRVGAVVRIGTDDEDMVRRLDAAYRFFQPFLKEPTEPRDVWPTGAAQRAFE